MKKRKIKKAESFIKDKRIRAKLNQHNIFENPPKLDASKHQETPQLNQSEKMVEVVSLDGLTMSLVKDNGNNPDPLRAALDLGDPNKDKIHHPNGIKIIHTIPNPMDSNIKPEDILFNNHYTDYHYYRKWDSFDNIFKNYDGSKGYLIFEPWRGGFNNIRMTLEGIVCRAYLTNRTLVIPPSYRWYLLEGYSNFSDFFEMKDIGVKTISYEEFCDIKKLSKNCVSNEIGGGYVEGSWDNIKAISKVLTYDSVSNVLAFEENVPKEFIKDRNVVRAKDLYTDEECIFSTQLLGSPHQAIYYPEKRSEIKKIMAKNIRYKKEIFDLAWKFIDLLGDRSYYSMHIRRNDFQYRHLFVNPENILRNIRDIIPHKSHLYISTDHRDAHWFKSFRNNYSTVIFYEDLRKQMNLTEPFNPNWIPIIEQLICSRSIAFVGNLNSTLSSYIFRMRGYMDDILDKKYYINTEKYLPERQIDFIDCAWGPGGSHMQKYDGNWVREFKDVWRF